MKSIAQAFHDALLADMVCARRPVRRCLKKVVPRVREPAALATSEHALRVAMCERKNGRVVALR